MSANCVKRGDTPDYVECDCGNDPITGEGFSLQGHRNALGGWALRCDECGALYHMVEIEQAKPGAAIVAFFHECSECGVDLADEWHDKSCSVYADRAQDVAAGEYP